MRCIPDKISTDFRAPIFGVGFWSSGAARAIMAVPEAAMHEHHLTQLGKNQIRFAGKVFAMKPEAEAHTMSHASHGHLRRGVNSFDCPHNAAALVLRLFHRRNSIFRLGSVSNSSTISL